MALDRGCKRSMQFYSVKKIPTGSAEALNVGMGRCSGEKRKRVSGYLPPTCSAPLIDLIDKTEQLSPVDPNLHQRGMEIKFSISPFEARKKKEKKGTESH